ncbi:MAG: efflux RND transporter periplasmic adaptor subunit [Chlamydiales bacterium]|nr:efflux RND transporter periplasmic adaptor subunit [Chlamydiales bacterium]
MKTYVLPSLAVLGACIALIVVFWTQKQLPVPPILFPPAESPYKKSIAGYGVIEASSENVSVGSPFSEIVTKIYVNEGDLIQKGDLLFELDLRSFIAQKNAAQARLHASLVSLEDTKVQFSFYERIEDERAVSETDYQKALFNLLEAQERVRVSKAQILEVEANIERSMIRSPVDGEVLQVNVHEGEIAPVVPFVSAQTTLILVGTVQPLQIRVNINEEESWRFRKGARATAFVRGNSRIHFPLDYKRIEPFMVPKNSLTGDTREKTDTRVLQILYEFDKKDLPIYVGQLVDIFIEESP